MKLIFKSQKRKSIMKPVKLNFFNPVKLNTSKSVKKVPLKNLTWSQASLRFPRMNPFGDIDKDGKLNMFDCRPFDKKRHGYYVYHVTSKKLLPQIMKEGLKANVPIYEPNSPKAVYTYGSADGMNRQISPRYFQIHSLLRDAIPEESKVIQETKDMEFDQSNKIRRERRKDSVVLAISLTPEERKSFSEGGRILQKSPSARDIEYPISGDIHPKKIKVVDMEKFNRKSYALKRYRNMDGLGMEAAIKEFKEQPEALQQLDANDNQIPDTEEIKSIEIKEED